MNILPAIQDRRAYRALSPETVDDDSLRLIAEAGSLAPSCYNHQPWRLLLVRGDRLAALKDCLPEGNRWASRAPAIIALSVRTADDCRLDEGRDYAYFDAGLCAMNMIIQATGMGLIAHPIAGYNPKKAKQALSIPTDYVLLNLIVIGKPGDEELLSEWQKQAEHGNRQRRPFQEVAGFESWPW